jgi:hypothetical protein
MIATKLTLDRKLRSIGLAEYFGGLYLADREALVGLWRNATELDTFVRNVCGLAEPPWFYWIEFHQWTKRVAKRAHGLLVPYSRDLGLILNRAAQIASRSGGRTGGALASRQIVLAMLEHAGTEFARKILESGIKPRMVRSGTRARGEAKLRRRLPYSDS